MLSANIHAIQGDAAQDAIVEQQRVDTYMSDKQRLWNEQQEIARVRGDNALKREMLDNVRSLSCTMSSVDRETFVYLGFRLCVGRTRQTGTTRSRSTAEGSTKSSSTSYPIGFKERETIGVRFLL